jgi:hypothetical protein
MELSVPDCRGRLAKVKASAIIYLTKRKPLTDGEAFPDTGHCPEVLIW